MTTLVSVSVVALFLTGMVAHATTYTGLREVGGNTVQLSVTTDSALGLLSPADITHFRVEIAGPLGHYVLTPANASVSMEQGRLTATQNSLVYDFTDPVGVNYFNFYQNGDPFPQYCLSSSFYCDASPGEAVSIYPLNAMFPSVYSNSETGLVTIATVASTVPEPSALVLMTVGFAFTGLASKRNVRNGVFG